MNLSQFASIAVIVGLVLLPSVIALLIDGPKDSESEFEHDYR